MVTSNPFPIFDKKSALAMNFRKILALLTFQLAVVAAFGQGEIRIVSLTHFPVAPVDTAYESNTYDSIGITISNIGNSVIVDHFDVFASARPADIDTIFYDPDTTNKVLQTGDSLEQFRNGFRFRPIHYDDGDNIIVVWPAARTTPNIISDSITFVINFASINGIIHTEKETIELFPNPAVEYFVLRSPDKNTFKQVRIFDSTGRMVFELTPGDNYIPVNDWQSGVYMLEVYTAEGYRIVKRLMVR